MRFRGVDRDATELAATQQGTSPEFLQQRGWVDRALPPNGRAIAVLASLGDPAVSAASWSVSILGTAAVAQALGIQLSITQAALIASGVALVSAVPAAPSNLGTFELAAQELAKAVGVEPASALAFAVLVHVTILLVTSIGGAIAFVRLGWSRAAVD